MFRVAALRPKDGNAQCVNCYSATWRDGGDRHVHHADLFRVEQFTNTGTSHGMIVCRRCLQTFAATVHVALTGDNTGTPVSTEAQAVERASLAVAQAARELMEDLDDMRSGSASNAVKTMQEYLAQPLAEWRDATETFLASVHANASR